MKHAHADEYARRVPTLEEQLDGAGLFAAPPDTTLDRLSRLPVGSRPVSTSEESADALEGKETLAQRRRRVLLLVQAAGPDGLTPDECCAIVGAHHNSYAPRFSELLGAGYLRRLEIRRPTRSGGNGYAHVLTSLGESVLR